MATNVALNVYMYESCISACMHAQFGTRGKGTLVRSCPFCLSEARPIVLTGTERTDINLTEVRKLQLAV